MAGYGYDLGVRTVVNQTRSSGVLSPIGEFEWGGAAGEYLFIDPSNRLSAFYGQHMLNIQEPYVHPRLKEPLNKYYYPFSCACGIISSSKRNRSDA